MFEKLKKWNKENDIKKKYPGYFNKKIIRTMAVAIMLLAFAMVFSIDEEATIFIECPKDSITRCTNMMYECNNNPNMMNFATCKQFKDIPCTEEICDKQFLEPGETLGKMPPFLQRNFFTIWFLIMLIGFGCNHILYKRKKK